VRLPLTRCVGVALVLVLVLVLLAASCDGQQPDKGQRTCSVDFPCFEQKFQCIGYFGYEYQRVETVPCEVQCGDIPCSGGGCGPTGPIMKCPPGTFCTGARTRLDNPCAAPDAGAPTPDSGPADAVPADAVPADAERDAVGTGG
jgi:hypothetical protein